MKFNYFANHRAEAIHLYRDILRACKMFTWRNEKGIPWSLILKQNARYEFEQARHEKDPELIVRMIIVGRDSLNKTMEKIAEKSTQMPPRS